MPCTRTGITLRSIPAGDGRVRTQGTAYPMKRQTIFSRLLRFASALDPRLSKIMELRQSDADRAFALCKEVYDDLQLIHLDYMSMFEELLSVLSDGPTAEAGDMLKKRRKEYEPIRVKLVAMCDQWEATRDPWASVHIVGPPPEAANFFARVVEYFPRDNLLHGTPTLAGLTLQRFEHVRTREQESQDTLQSMEEHFRKQYVRIVEGTISKCRKKWRMASEAYARLSFVVAGLGRGRKRESEQEPERDK